MVLPLLVSCGKNSAPAEAIQPADLTASESMADELSEMLQAMTQFALAHGDHEQHHWDSIYHHHDSLFWHHHENYHHNTYTHDDHNHHWTHYDPAVDHASHSHHRYPGHLNDSLVTTPNDYYHINCDHHPGHQLCHHQIMDSVHYVHSLHHP